MLKKSYYSIIFINLIMIWFDLILFIGLIKDSCQFHLQDDKLRFEFNLNRK